MSQEVVISRAGELMEAEVDGELIALHVDSGTCYGFNNTATRIWALLSSPRTLADLCRLLTAEFDVEPADCERDVTSLLAELKADGLVRIEGELPASHA